MSRKEKRKLHGDGQWAPFFRRPTARGTKRDDRRGVQPSRINRTNPRAPAETSAQVVSKPESGP